MYIYDVLNYVNMFDLFLNNYRSFLNQKLKFSRINILIGENSGGKSSLLKLLLALKQTLDYPTEANLKLSGDFTNLGNFEEVVYGRKKNRKISIGFEMKEKHFDFALEMIQNIEGESSKKQISLIKKLLNPYQDSTTFLLFEFSSNLDDHASIKTTIKNNVIGQLEIVQRKPKDDFAGGLRLVNADLKFEFTEVSGVIENCECNKEGFLTLVDQEVRAKCEKKFKEKSDYVFYTLAFMLISQNYVQNQIDKIRFVNPIGTSPKRFYFQEDKKASYRLIDIEKFINVMSDSKLSKKGYDDRLSLLNKTIREFGIAEEVEIIKDKQLPVLALNVKTKGFWSNITDVGYGVSLQIPILFQALLSENYTKNGQTILIEQPEVHLHPTLQAKFIETLLSIGNKNVYFIETHSEHIVRKLQALVKNKAFNLKPEDITINYFRREPDKFNITKHEILNSGKLSPSFPSGFFDTSYSLAKELL